jgi:O-antigen/teichoic acid export membrane protein
LGREQLKDTLYLSIANAFARIIGFLMPFVLINYGGEEIYGKFAFILTTLSTIIAFFSSGLTNVVSRYMVNEKEGERLAVFDELIVKSVRLIAFVMIASLLFFAFGHVLFGELLQLRFELLLGLIYILFTLIGNFITGYHFVKKNYLKLSLSILVPSIVQLLLLIPMAKYFGIMGVVCAYIIFSFLQLWLLVRKEIDFNWESLKGSFKRFSEQKNSNQGLFLKFLLPIFIASIAVPASIWYANHQVAAVFGFSDLGFINIALQMQVVMAFLPNIFNSMAVPILSHSFNNDKTIFFSNFKKLAFKTLSISGLLFTLIFLFAKEILDLYSSNYSVYEDILRVFSFSFFVSIILNIAGVVILSVASMWWGAILNFIWAIFFIGSLVIFLPIYGLMGFAYSYLLSYSFHLVSVFIYLFYFFKKNV